MKTTGAQTKRIFAAATSTTTPFLMVNDQEDQKPDNENLTPESTTNFLTQVGRMDLGFTRRKQN